MFSPRITAAFGSAVGAAAIGLAVATAGTASASIDDTFLAQIKAIGISVNSPQDAISAAHTVCKELASGKSATDIAAEIKSQTDLTAKQAAYVVVYATNDYCPQYATQST